jgi:hypothetical protein
MPTSVVRASYGTYVDEAFPGQNQKGNGLTVRAGTDLIRHSFVYFPLPEPVADGDATVQSAYLRTWLKSGWSAGPHPYTANRVTGGWSEDRIRWDDAVAITTTNNATQNITDGADGDLVEHEVTGMLADVAAGGVWKGIRLGTTSSGAVRRIYPVRAADPQLRPLLVVEWSRKPKPPVDLSPSGDLRVNRAKPTLTWRFRDPDGDGQAEFQVQVANNEAMTTSVFDTGWVVSSDEELDLEGTAITGLTDAEARYWRVRTKDESGLISDWSDVEKFTRVVKGTFTIDSPLDAGQVRDTTPPIVTTLASRDQEAIGYTLEEWRPADSEWVEVWHDGRHAAAEDAGDAHTEHPPAGKLRFDDRDYRLTVNAWDGIDRVWDGDPVYYTDQVTFTFDTDAGIGPVTSLTAEPEGEGPGVKLTFNRAAGLAMPDHFALKVDGERVFDRIDPANIDDGGDPIVFSMIYYGADPREARTYEVEAVQISAGERRHSQGNDTATFTSTPSGIWFVDDEDAPYWPSNPPFKVQIIGSHESTPGLAIGESSATYNPIGRRDPVTVVDAIRGLEGSVTGLVKGVNVDKIQQLKRPYNVGRRWRLIVGAVSIPVEVGAIDQFAPKSGTGPRVYEVSVNVVQVGEYGELA